MPCLKRCLNDNDPAIRTAAIGLLEPVDADTSVRQVLLFCLQFGPESSDPECFPASFEPGSGIQ
jgi:hypothetical protein